MNAWKICIVTATGETSHTIIFADAPTSIFGEKSTYYSDARIHPDDSIRTIKMKLLHELHQGKHANQIQLRPSYEELYMYGFAAEEISTLQLFDAFRLENKTDEISRDVITQIVEGHPAAKSILNRLPSSDKISYADFESTLSEEKVQISVKTPLGIQFTRGYRDPTFEVDPFFVEKHRAYLVEHSSLHYFDDDLLLNYNELVENTIYVCLADRVYESIDKAAEEYIARYYFTGLYKTGIKSKETLVDNRGKLVKSTQKLLTDERSQYYKSIDTFYAIASAEDPQQVQYISKGIQKITILLKTPESRRGANAKLGEMLFKNMHCTREVPYIKYNPGNRREKIYRFYFEKTTRTGKKIPYLSRSHIMRMAKETGRGQQISVYLEGAVLGSNRLLSNCYAHFESNGNIQLQLTMTKPVDEPSLDSIIHDQVLPHLTKIGRDVRQTGYHIPEYTGLRDTTNTKIVSMEFVTKTAATRNVDWESVPCIYSICTINSMDKTGTKEVRLKRVENFKEMDAAHILIAELYGQVQYGELGLQDIVDELVARGLTESEERARVIIAEFLATINEMNGEIIERPGFPMEMTIDSEEKTVEFRVSELSSIYYLDTVGIYIDAIVKTTQLYKDSNPLLKQLKKLCKKAVKFREVEMEPDEAPRLLREATMVDGPLRLTKLNNDDDFFAQFASDDEEDEYRSNAVVDYQEEDDSDAEDLLSKLRKNTKPIAFESDSESESEKEPEPETKQKTPVKEPVRGPIMLSDDEDSEPEPKPQNKKPVPKKQAPEKTNSDGRILQFHSKSALLKSKDAKPYLDAGMPDTAMRDLSNFADFSVEYNGKIYATVEHAFQSQKYVFSKYEEPKPKKKQAKRGEDNPKTLDEILASFTVDGKMTALDAKKEGGRKAMEMRGYTLDIMRWTKESVPLMKALIKSKIERNPEIKRILDIAKRFDVKLAHFSRSDMKWGCHMTEDGKAIKDGKNLLGEIYNNYMYGNKNALDLGPVEEYESGSENEKEEMPPLPPKKQEAQKPGPGPIMFDSDSEDEESGGAGKAGVAKAVKAIDPADLANSDDEDEDETDNQEEEDKYRLVPDGMPLKSVILKKLQKRDPVIFTSTKKPGIYKTFSTSCQPTTRHPVILTQEEMDRTDKSAYQHAIKYGSDPNNQHYFICPRFWCFLTNSAISEEEAKSGKCGKIIPKNAETVPKGAYVYELNKDDNDQYPFPGFMENTRADGKCLPCCFKNWKGKKQTEARERCEKQMKTDVAEESDSEPEEKTTKKKAKPKKQNTKANQYIISLDTYPVPTQRFGFLPIPVQLFLQIDYRPILDPNNPALLKPDKEVLLRYGVEQPLHQSFLGCFADIYAHRQGLNAVPTVADFRRILTEAIDLDVFAKAHNGSLLSAFYPKDTTAAKRPRVPKDDRKKYTDTEFALGLDLKDNAMKRYFDDAILAYENFIAFLSDQDAKIDHQYLWDFVCDDNRKIMPKGVNLVILEIQANDIIDRIELVCPTNLYSRNQFDAAKDTVLLLKHEDVYEPIYMYQSGASGAPKVTRFLVQGKVPETIADMLKRVEQATRKYCPGLPSLPKIYRFANPIPMQRLLGALVKIGAKIEAQVVNYQGKTIGLLVVEKSSKKDKTENAGAIYVPCAPSARLQIPIKYMDSLTIPKEYERTVESLNRISASAKIPCKPVWKIKEEGLIVGFLTETNQFVPIKPNEDIIADGLQTYEGVNAFAADKTAATEYKGDRTRIKMTKYITLESQFYHAFRNRVRTLFSQFANRNLKNEIRKIADDPTILYAQKIERIEPLVEQLIEGHVIFVEISKSVLLDMAEVNECDDSDDEGPNCIIKENGIAQLVVPKWHLISKYDNEKIYVGRMADELVRNERIKSIMYDTETRLNSQNTDYQLKPDEFILVQSALTPDYFAELDANVDTNPYAKQTNYELASPSISVVYPDEKIPLAEQYQPPIQEKSVKQTGKLEENPESDECLVRVSKIIGNQKQVWDRIFSDDAREHIYRDTAKCTFKPVIRVVESKLGEKWSETDVKTRLSSAYMKLFESDSDNLLKIAKIMRDQGKSKMVEKFVKIKSGATPEEFQDVVMSDGYYLTDIDIWVLANEYNLPIVVFNANGLKGFFAKINDTSGPVTVNAQWIKMGGDKDDKYHFIRSKIRVAKGSFANHIYEYHLIVPEVRLSETREFEGMVVDSVRGDRLNTAKLEEVLERFF